MKTYNETEYGYSSSVNYSDNYLKGTFTNGETYGIPYYAAFPMIVLMDSLSQFNNDVKYYPWAYPNFRDSKSYLDIFVDGKILRYQYGMTGKLFKLTVMNDGKTLKELSEREWQIQQLEKL